MKRGIQNREKKNLSAKGLLAITRRVFSQVTNKRRSGRLIAIDDSLMSALAMFSLKSQSLLAFDQARLSKAISHNLKTLYGIKAVPSDTYMRQELDEVDPFEIRSSFKLIFEAVQRGKLLEEYGFLDSYLLAVDGTGLFNSTKIHCVNCCEKNHRDGTKSYYHQVLAAAIVHPGRKQVLPLCPEMISKQDGAIKNDCERRALQRLLGNLKTEHPRLKLTITSDALSANSPTIQDIISANYHYLINVAPAGNKSLFEWVNGADTTIANVEQNGNKYVFRFINKVPLNNTANAPEVNFIECIATETIGRKTQQKTFSWVTNHHITKANVLIIMQGGRARWKIENETFNTLKNQGYQFEHNFGHGKKHLGSVFALLMMLAFLIDQIQEATCGLFQAALQKTVSRRALWESMRNYFYVCLIEDWSDLFWAISQKSAVTLDRNTS